jgi:xeroderma pigmentosum group C-complementing protein
LSLDPEDQNVADEDNAGTALYAAHQTTVYSAPPVVNGRIAKNVYRNLDVYVPSMVPSGGIHIPHPETARAAKIIGIDYADAVTGFVFKGRHGTAVTKGAVIAVEYKEAVEEVIKAFEDDRARAEEDRRSLEALRMWKRMLAGLRIMERIEGYNVEGERGEREIAMQEGMKKVDEEDDEGEGGGFLPDRDAAIDFQPTAGSIPAEGWANMVDDDDGGGFLPEDCDEASPAQREIDPPRPRDHFINNLEDDDGGGFLVNDGDADAEEALREINAASRYPSQSINRVMEYNPAVHDDQVDSPQAGGFLPDGAVSSNEPTSKTINEPAIKPMPMPTTISTSKHNPHPAIPDPSNQEATTSQQLYETPNIPPLPTITQNTAPLTPPNLPTSQPPNNPPPVSSSKNPPPTSISPTKSSSSSPSPPSSPERDREINESRLEAESTSSSSSEEKSSLLSHDPDDEDAEPEWLV